MKRSVLSCKQFLETFHGFRGIFIGAERSQAEIVFSVLSESCAGGAHYLDVFQQVIKAFPGFHSVRALKPDIRRIDAAEETDVQTGQRISDHFRVFLIISDILLAFTDAFLGEHGFPVYNGRDFPVTAAGVKAALSTRPETWVESEISISLSTS